MAIHELNFRQHLCQCCLSYTSDSREPNNSPPRLGLIDLIHPNFPIRQHMSAHGMQFVYLYFGEFLNSNFSDEV